MVNILCRPLSNDMMPKTATLKHEVTKHYECDTVYGSVNGTVD